MREDLHRRASREGALRSLRQGQHGRGQAGPQDVRERQDRRGPLFHRPGRGREGARDVRGHPDLPGRDPGVPRTPDPAEVPQDRPPLQVHSQRVAAGRGAEEDPFDPDREHRHRPHVSDGFRGVPLGQRGPEVPGVRGQEAGDGGDRHHRRRPQAVHGPVQGLPHMRGPPLLRERVPIEEGHRGSQGRPGSDPGPLRGRCVQVRRGEQAAHEGDLRPDPVEHREQEEEDLRQGHREQGGCQVLRLRRRFRLPGGLRRRTADDMLQQPRVPPDPIRQAEPAEAIHGRRGAADRDPLRIQREGLEGRRQEHQPRYGVRMLRRDAAGGERTAVVLYR